MFVRRKWEYPGNHERTFKYRFPVPLYIQPERLALALNTMAQITSRNERYVPGVVDWYLTTASKSPENTLPIILPLLKPLVFSELPSERIARGLAPWEPFTGSAIGTGTKTGKVAPRG